FTPKLNGMASLYPLQTRRVAVQRVGKVGIYATLGKKRQKWIVDSDRGHPAKPVRCQVRRETHRTESRIIVTHAGGVYAVHAESVGQECARSDGPVILYPAILRIRQINRAVPV